MKDWNTTTAEASSAIQTPRISVKNASPTSPANSRGSMTTPTRSSSYGSPLSTPGSVDFNGAASMEKLSKMVSEFVMSNFSEVLDEQRTKYEDRYNIKLEEMEIMQNLIDELNGKVENLTHVVRGLEDDKADLEREVNVKEKEITRLEAESDSMKAFMKQSLSL